jgi:hypothetical protein
MLAEVVLELFSSIMISNKMVSAKNMCLRRLRSEVIMNDWFMWGP